MKYHGHEIIRVKTDLGEEKASLNCVYQIFKDGKYLEEAPTVGMAKDYIDSGYDINYIS